MSSYYCYIIYNPNDRTYNGYTVNLERRLRQHNGLLKGGARATHNRGEWKYLFVMTSTCWEDASVAMKHEWSIKYPTRRRPRPKEYNGKLGRLRSLDKVFTHMATLACDDVTCYVHPDYMELVSKLSEPYSFVTIRDINALSI